MSDLILRKEGRAGRVTLNRPQALNALTYDMAMALEGALDEWAQDDSVELVVIDSAGDRAFCAGGDVQALYRSGVEQDWEYGRRFWRDEYRLNAKIANYAKPYVALMDGIAMGGGVGVSAHGSHRVVTERTQVAMPECRIGLIPDVGGSLILARAPGRLGEYAALTAARLGPADAMLLGFADMFAPADRLDDAVARLCRTGDVEALSAVSAPPPASALEERRGDIDTLFAAPSLQAIVEALTSSDAAWAPEARKAIAAASPLCLAAALSAIRRARDFERIEQALAQEYRFAWRCMSDGEFIEGVRAAVIDKDRRPRWAHPSIETLSQAIVDGFLASLGEHELRL